MSDITIPDDAWEGLGIFAHLSEDQLKSLGEFLAAEALPLDLEISPVAAKAASAVGVTERQAREILLAVVLPLGELRRRMGLAPDVFLNGFLEAATDQSEASWRESHLDSLRGAAGHLPAMWEGGRFVQLWFKAQQLVYNRPGILTDFKILTELRPIFDEAVSRTEAMVSTNTLVVEFFENGEDRKLHLSLGRGLLNLIAAELERAQKKSAMVANEAETWHIPLVGKV